jgi:hypothetical protein
LFPICEQPFAKNKISFLIKILRLLTIHKLKPTKMKKIFAIIALAGIMVSCGGKKKDAKVPEQPTTNEPSKMEPSNTGSTAGIPTFSDPDVQKFVNEYSAFAQSYKTGIVDPAKAMELSKTAQEWSGKMMNVAMKVGSNPDELKKWQQWAEWLRKEMTPAMPK